MDVKPTLCGLGVGVGWSTLSRPIGGLMKRCTGTILYMAMAMFFARSASASDVGTIQFPTSTSSTEAQAHFVRGATILHSFGWKQAIVEFKRAQAADPDFAMAYWGESLCYNHPLLPEFDRKPPQEVLLRLAPTSEQRLAKAPTKREQGFLRAADALAFGSGDIQARRTAYMEAMRDLYEAHPGDDEVAALYALSLISAGGASGKAGERQRVLAGSIALQLFARDPDHPGAAHYAIHAFDDPVHAPLALPAARKFASIAPVVSHARHMPTHIFIQLGMWKQVSTSNQSAYEAAVDLWEPGDSAADMAHALDWGQYGDLQRGDYERAAMWIERARGIVRENPGQARVTGVLPRVEARLILETRNWHTRPITDESTTPELLATGISAAKLGDLELATRAAEKLARLAEEAAGGDSLYWRTAKPLAIMSEQVAGMISIARDDTDEGLARLRASVEIAEQMPLPRGAANPIKPARELYGEALLAAGKPLEAAEQFEALLLRMPNRPLALLGLARARVASGDDDAASERYRQLAEVWRDWDLPELHEAAAHLSGAAGG